MWAIAAVFGLARTLIKREPGENPRQNPLL